MRAETRLQAEEGEEEGRTRVKRECIDLAVSGRGQGTAASYA